MTNIRQFLKCESNYSTFNREERNLAAVFYHLLLSKDNLHRFLDFIDCDFKIVPEQLGVYFEYAYLRDIWSTITDNETRRHLILDFLKPSESDRLSRVSILDFNEYFGAVPRASAEYIQCPSNWSIRRYESTITDNDDFLKVCKFKWSFNAKPDIVIHTSRDEAVCIEAKLESGEGRYPSQEREKAIFRERGIKTVGQMELQHYMMTELLGIHAMFLFLVKKVNQKSTTHTTISWDEAFRAMDTDGAPAFVRQFIASAAG